MQRAKGRCKIYPPILFHIGTTNIRHEGGGRGHDGGPLDISYVLVMKDDCQEISRSNTRALL